MASMAQGSRFIFIVLNLAWQESFILCVCQNQIPTLPYTFSAIVFIFLILVLFQKVNVI